MHSHPLRLLTLLTCLASAHAADLGPRLQASLVWSPAVPAGQQAYVAFRRAVDLPQAPTAATLHLFADSRYILWINGRYVLRGPCRFDPQRPEYDSVEVAPYLRAGRNVLVALVHGYAGGHNSKIIEHAPGFGAVLTVGGAETVRTDTAWRCSSRTRYRPSPAAWGSIPDVIDARLETGDWTQPDFDDSAWEAARAVDGALWGALQPRAIPLARERELTGLRGIPAELSAGQQVTVDLGRMAMAWAAVDLEADADSVLKLSYSLRSINGQPTETYGEGTTYTARAGRQSFVTGDEWGCHYVTLRCAVGRVKVLGLTMTDRRYPFQRVGRFACSDPFLNRLWEMAVNTIEATCDDAYGADARERNEWLQDPAQPNFITSRVALAGPGEGGRPVYSDPRLLKNLLRHIALSQTPDGRLKAHSISDRWDIHGYIEDYACQWVESLRLYWLATGDDAFVREMWPALVRQMRWFLDHRTPRGLVSARQYTSFDDPLAYVTCEGTALNAFVAQALRDATALGAVIGQPGYAREAADLTTAIHQHLWNAAEGTYDSGYVKDKRLGPTAHAALLALARGVVPAERVASTRAWFQANYQRPAVWHCGDNNDYEQSVARRAGIGMPVTYYWVFGELYRMDSASADALALGEMRRRWARMVKPDDCGTLWEMFSGPESCHNYGSVPAWFLSSYVLGVRLDGPVSGRRLIIEPRLADLTEAGGVVCTEFGPVPVAWRREGRQLRFNLDVPPGTRARLRLPDAEAKTLIVDGKPAKATVDGRYVCAELGAGAHAGTVTTAPAPPPAPATTVVEQRLSAEGATPVVTGRTTDASLAGFESDITTAERLAIAGTEESGAAHDGGAPTPAALLNGTTLNAAGGDATATDGKTFRGYAAGQTLTLRLARPCDLSEIRTFAGHDDQRASQSYAVSAATADAPDRFEPLGEARLVCAGGSSQVRLAAGNGALLAKRVVAVRLSFGDGPLGFCVYREVVLLGQPSKEG